jgi:uncharacterized SAM-binding protein YcdF (DUF218 family)
LLLFLDQARTLLKALLLPPAGLVLLAALGALLLRRRVRLGSALLLLGLGGLWVLSLPQVADGLTRALQQYPALSPTADIAATRAQAVVILGGGGQRTFAAEYGGPAAGPYLLQRLAYGAFVARRGQLPVLVSGWHVEATAMRATLRQNFGIDARWVDSQSYDTFDNAHNSARLLASAGVQRIILVTSTQHIGRATREFAATGLSVTPAPVGVIAPRSARYPLALLGYLPDPQALQNSYEVIYELLGERVRELLAVTHLRHQQAVEGKP